MTTNIRQKVVSLNDALYEASEAYYKKNQPIMPDAEFDALERELKDLTERYSEFRDYAPFLNLVGSDFTGGRIQHATPMLSIENKYEESDLLKWYDALP